MTQIVSLIVAADKNGVIGHKGGIPWRLPADLEYFKQKTVGHSVIMGSYTHESIGRVLPNRRNIVLTRRKNYRPRFGVWNIRDIEFALYVAGQSEVFVIGGGQIYREFFPRAHRLYLTLVHGEFEGDTFFPEIKREEWKEISREFRKADEKNPHDLEWIVYERIPTKK